MSNALGKIVEVGSLGLIDGDFITGQGAADAATQAAAMQARSADKAIDLQRESRDLAREDLAPFRQFGADQINPLMQLLNPQGQADYLSANPLFERALESVNNATLSNQAARGKLGSGGTLQALTDNYMATAMPFINSQQNALFNAVNMGQSSAAGQANTALNSANSISNLFGQKGDARAAGIVGAQGAEQAAFNNMLNLGIQGGKMLLGGF